MAFPVFLSYIFVIFLLFELDNLVFHFSSVQKRLSLSVWNSISFHVAKIQKPKIFLIHGPNEIALNLHKLKYQNKLRGNNKSLAFSAPERETLSMRLMRSNPPFYKQFALDIT